MAIAFGHFSSSAFGTSPLTWTHDSTGDTCIFIAIDGDFTADITTITAVTYRGVDITSSLVANTATTHQGANKMGVVLVNLSTAGITPGSGSISITFTGGGNLGGALAASYSGTIDSSLSPIDGSWTTNELIGATPNWSQAFTTSASSSYPIMMTNVVDAALTLSSGSSSTVRGNDSFVSYLIDRGATAASGNMVVNDSSGGHFIVNMVAAIKAGSAGSSGSADGVATVSGVGQDTFAGVGNASGQASASGVTGTVGIAAGAATVSGVATSPSAITISKPSDPTTPSTEIGGFFATSTLTSGVGDIPISGTATSANGYGVEAQFNGGGWFDIGATISGNAYSGTASAQTAGVGNLQVRVKQYPAVTSSTVKIGVGPVVLIQGDSLAVDDNAPPITPGSQPQQFFEYLDTSAKWFRQDNQGPGPIWGYLAIQMVNGLNVPYGWMNTAASGSTLIGHWDANNGGSDADWLASVQKVNDGITAGAVSSVNKVLVMLGPNDVHLDSGITAAAYKTAIGHLDAGNAASIAGAPATHFAMFSDFDPASFGGPTDPTYISRMNNVRGGIVNAYLDSTVAIGANNTGQQYADKTHPETDALSLAISLRFYSDVVIGHHSPFENLIFQSSTTQIVIQLDHAIDNALSSSVAGFSVKVGGSPITLSSQTITGTNPGQITLTASSPFGVGTITVCFASAEDAVGQTIPYYNQTTPTLGPVQMVLEPFFDLQPSSGIAIGAADGAASVAAIGQSLASVVGASTGAAAAAGVAGYTFGVLGQASANAIPASNFGVFGIATVNGIALGGGSLSIVPQLRWRRAVLPM
jgi:hypothetical protein